MIKMEWGTKRYCPNCQAKFYDLNKQDIICPACEKAFDVEASIRLKRNNQDEFAQADKKPEDEGDLILDDDLDASIGDDGDETVLEDTSDIDNDDDIPVKIIKDDDEE